MASFLHVHFLSSDHALCWKNLSGFLQT